VAGTRFRKHSLAAFMATFEVGPFEACPFKVGPSVACPFKAGPSEVGPFKADPFEANPFGWFDKSYSQPSHLVHLH